VDWAAKAIDWAVGPEKKKIIGFVTPSNMKFFDYHVRHFFDSLGNLHILRKRSTKEVGDAASEYYDAISTLLTYTVAKYKDERYYLCDQKVSKRYNIHGRNCWHAVTQSPENGFAMG
jgi:hypothetical protein